MPKKYQQLIDQAVINGVITPWQYLQIPWHERESMKYLLSYYGQLSLANGDITFKQYLQIPAHKRQNVIAALRNYGMRDISVDGRQAIAVGVMTLEQYRQIPSNERDTMEPLFSADGRQALADGVITLEQYRQIPSNERGSMESLFSADGRQAVADGLITLEEYLQISRDEHQNVMTALRDPDTRQRMINGEITIENIIGVRRRAHGAAVAVPYINGAQSTHTASVHDSASKSATKLVNRYKSKINGTALESTIRKAQAYIRSLPNDSKKNKAAQEGFLRIAAPDYTFTDPSSQVTIRQLLALAFLAIHDDEKRVGSLKDAQMQFVEGLYEIQRGYNLSEAGIDQGGEDRYICSAGTFSKLIEKLQGIHPDCVVLYITEATASNKLPIVVREEGMRYLTTFSKPNTVEALRTFTI